MGHKVVVMCWEHGHESELFMTKRQEDALSQKVLKLKAVCPTCKEMQLGNKPIFVKEGSTVIYPEKLYKCNRGHVTSIGLFTNGMLHVKFGIGNEDFFNTEGSPDELVDKIDVVCHHVFGDEICERELTAIDSFVPSYPHAVNFKTKTRVGDLWDKSNIEPVRPGHYDKDANYHQTRSELANKERLKTLRQRNVAADKIPGRRIDKATKTRYDSRNEQ